MSPLLSAPVIAFTSPNTDNTPEATADLTLPQAGDVITWQRADDAGFTTNVQTYTDTLDSTEVGNLQTSGLAFGTWTNGTYYNRAKHSRGATDSAWSSTVTKTIAPGIATNGIVSEGDSISTADYASPSWPAQWATLTGMGQVSRATSGDTLSAINTNYATDVAPSYNASTANTLVLLGGVNDFGTSKATASAVQTSVQAIAAKARTTGFKVAVCTVLPTNFTTGAYWGTSEETQRTTYNTWLRANWASFADVLVDTAAISALSDPDNTYYYVDKLHPTNKGLALIAELVRTSLGVSLVSDTTPAAFTFTDATSVAVSTVSTSVDVQITGITTGTAFSVTGGTLVINGVDAGASGTVYPYDKVAARGTSSASNSTATNVVVTIGGVSDTYTITTIASGVSASNLAFAVANFGVVTRSNVNQTITSGSATVASRISSAIVGKKLVAFTLNTYTSDFPGIGLLNTSSNDNIGFSVTPDIGWYNNAAVNRTNVGQTAATTFVQGNTVGMVVDETNAQVWFTKDGVTFYGTSATATRAQVEAGTVAGYSISALKAAGSFYSGAFNSFGGSGTVWTVQQSWPWTAVSGYTYLT